MLTNIVLGVALASIIIGGAALILACYCLIELRAMQKSTHSIQWMPVEPPQQPTAVDQSLENPFENIL